MTSTAASFVALIPARSGSLRVPGKNLWRLNGHPLIAYTIAAARDSGVFDRVIVSTNDSATAAVATHYGADVPFLRPDDLAGPTSPDIDWIRHALDALTRGGTRYDAFSILRPTSPLRQRDTIRRAANAFFADGVADSLRAVELCRQHPGKMWVLDGARMRPLLDDGGAEPPWHSSAYQSLPPVYAQNASLEIAWTRVVEQTGTIAGQAVMPFVTEGAEGFDLNHPEDRWLLERMLAEGSATLPAVREQPYPEKP